MSVSVEDGLIRLEGACTVEEAEVLVGYLQETKARPVDIGDCRLVHTAIVQALLAFHPELVGESSDPFIRDRLTPALRAARQGAGDGVALNSATTSDADPSLLQGDR